VLIYGGGKASIDATLARRIACVVESDADEVAVDLAPASGIQV
jgi:hypothetical protein